MATWYARAVPRIQAVESSENTTYRDAESGAEYGVMGRAAGVAGLVAILAAIVAGATIWLLLTDPVAVATVVETGEVSPLVRQLADVIYSAIVGLLDYL